MGRGFRLTQLQVDRTKGKNLLADGAGLYLNITENGSRSWLYRYMLLGKAHWMGLGSYPDVSLVEAREQAAEARKLTRQGIDPLTQKREHKQVVRATLGKLITFDEAAKQFIADNQAGWRNPKHVAQWHATLETYASPKIGALDVGLIETAHIVNILKPIWTKKTETASRVRGRIENVLDWATVHRYRSGENPARWKGHLEHILPKPSAVAKVEHHAALPWKETATFMKALRKQEGIGARALEFLILTAARSGEVRLAPWSEFDLDAGVWTVSSERMKARREHRVPLPARAVAIVREMKNLNSAESYVFPGTKTGRPMSDMTLTAVLKRMERGALTAHGFRSTFRDWAAEATDYPAEMAEMALAHTVSDKVEAAYRRGDLFDKRRKMTEDWSNFCNTPCS